MTLEARVTEMVEAAVAAVISKSWTVETHDWRLVGITPADRDGWVLLVSVNSLVNCCRQTVNDSRTISSPVAVFRLSDLDSPGTKEKLVRTCSEAIMGSVRKELETALRGVTALGADEEGIGHEVSRLMVKQVHDS